MYPERTPLLVTLLVICAAVAAYIAVRRPFLRKLALRQVARRRGEATLVVAGSVLGTAIIVGSLVVGDTLNYSVKQGAYTNLGPIDEIVASPTVAQGDQAADRLEGLRGDPQVDGLLTVRGDQAAAETLTVYLYGRPAPFRVARVVPTKGVAGVGTGAVTRNAFFAPGTLVQAARAAGGKAQPQTVTFVSNAGGVEAGDDASDAVEAKIRAALGPLAAQGTSVDKAKQGLLDAAK